MNLEDYEYKKSGKGYKVKVSCLNCGKEWWKTWSSVKQGGGKYCSRECQSKHKFYDDPGLEKYETRIAPDRYIEVKIKCKRCGDDAWVRWNRVKVGWGLYCGRTCANRDSLESQDRPSRFGKENAGVSFDKPANRYIVYWKDEKGKRHNLPYAKWWWEVNKGEIPEGYHATHKDEDWSNIDDDNICLISKEDYGDRISNRMMGHKHSEETKQKLSEAHKGKTLSKEHKENIGNASRKMWDDGVFDDVHVGEHNHNWRGGVEIVYPSKFLRKRRKIRGRDLYRCRICKNKQTQRNLPIHHIDGNPLNNINDNLITLCENCHILIHAKNKDVPVEILAFRSMLKH